MNDDIKEMLDNLKDEVWSKTGADSYDKLLDYITNLQQENERLKKKNDSLGETNLRINGDLKVAKQDRIEYSNELEDYKSRIEKAVNKIYNLKIHVQSFEGRDKIPCWIDELENILNGKE